MAYNEYLEERISTILVHKKIFFEKKKMFGGLTFMVKGKMCVGIVKDDLMARVGPKLMEEALSKNGCRDMDFTGRPMKGYVFVNQDGIDTEEDLDYYINASLDFNTELTK